VSIRYGIGRKHDWLHGTAKLVTFGIQLLAVVPLIAMLHFSPAFAANVDHARLDRGVLFVVPALNSIACNKKEAEVGARKGHPIR
jgi:hypothetical protein